MWAVGWNILILLFVCLAAGQVPEKCSAPPKYPNTKLCKKHSNKQTFDSGVQFYYNCAWGYKRVSGTRVVKCLNGEWTKLFLNCERLSCSKALNLPNGWLEYQGNAYLGEKVTAKCNKGYTLNGSSSMICRKSVWNGIFPSCEVEKATCPFPAVGNSVSSGGAGSVYQVGDSVSFTCDRGFNLDGAQQITCGPGGKWETKPPQCLPLPDKERGCGVPKTTSNSHANLVDKYMMMESFASGDRVYYVCDVGYVHAQGSKYRTCVKGEWTPLQLKCERRICGSAGELLNGQYGYSGVEFGDTARAVCDEGYRLVGKEIRNCLSQGWDGRLPVCEAVDCNDPPLGKNVELIGQPEPPFTYRRVVGYRCQQGTMKGSQEIWCTKDGTWNALPPTCEEVTCPPPSVPGAFWTGSHRSRFQPRDHISIECDWAYEKTGPSFITCGSDGRWEPSLPKCTLKASRRNQWR